MTLSNFFRGLKQFSLWHRKQISIYLYAGPGRKQWIRKPLTDELLRDYGGFLIDDMLVQGETLVIYMNAIYHA